MNYGSTARFRAFNLHGKTVTLRSISVRVRNTCKHMRVRASKTSTFDACVSSIGHGINNFAKFSIPLRSSFCNICVKHRLGTLVVLAPLHSYPETKLAFPDRLFPDVITSESFDAAGLVVARLATSSGKIITLRQQYA